jgi:hypothetical protein
MTGGRLSLLHLTSVEYFIGQLTLSSSVLLFLASNVTAPVQPSPLAVYEAASFILMACGFYLIVFRKFAASFTGIIGRVVGFGGVGRVDSTVDDNFT